MKKRILLLSTGGTIASLPGKDGLEPAAQALDILHYAGFLHHYYDIDAKDILKLDSSNIQPEEWQLIAGHIFSSLGSYDGIVVTHGTDTLAYTSSMLSYMLRNLPIPVVITGSQLPAANPLSDAAENLRTAFAMAASGVPGVFVAFAGRIILGTRAVKVRTTGFQAFESVNSPYAALIDAAGLNINRRVIPASYGVCALQDQLEKQVILVKLTPGLNPEIFDMLLSMSYKGIVIEAFGLGGFHFIRRDLISKLQRLVENHVTVVVCSQCLYERSDFSIYQTGAKALEQGVIQGYDMTTEAAITKLMWVLGQTEDPDEIRKLFETSLAGEIALN